MTKARNVVEFLHHLISDGQWHSLLLAGALLTYAGRRMVDQRPSLELWCQRGASMVMGILMPRRLILFGSPIAADIVAAVFLGLIGGAVVIGPTWMLLSALAVLRDLIRNVVAPVKRWAPNRRKYTLNPRSEWEQSQHDCHGRQHRFDARSKRCSNVKTGRWRILRGPFTC